MDLAIFAFCCFTLPGFVLELEYWHVWSKLYNRVVTFLNSNFHTRLTYREWPEPHNTVTHQFKMFCIWLGIGGTLYIAYYLAKYMFYHP